MAYRFILLACLLALCLQNAYSQAINCRPNCGCQQQVTVTETCVQNPVLFNPGCQTTVVSQPGCQRQTAVVAQPTCQCQSAVVAQPSCQCQTALVAQPSCQCQTALVAQPNYVATAPTVVANPCCEVDYISQYAIPTTTIIQEDSVANNLANALQLLIVSNLLSNSLPFNDIVNLGVPAITQPSFLAQPSLLAQPALQFASPALQVAQVAQPAFKIGGCGCCGCNCGCNGLTYVL